MDVDDHDIVCPRSLPCLAGALLMLPVAESTRLLRRWQASYSLIRLIRGLQVCPIECFTVFAGNLVYYVLLMFGRCGSFSVREYGSQGIGRLEDCSNVIPR